MNFTKVMGIYIGAGLIFALSAFASPKDTKKAEPAAKGKTVYALFDTSEGKFKVKLFKDESPKTVENFVTLANGTNSNPKLKPEFKGKHYFDGLIFHRIIPDFMIQGGDPKGNGTGDPGYKFDDEKSKTLHFDKKGILAMANSGPNSNGSQFFITVKTPLSWLEGSYTIFGEVTEGYDVVEKISKVPTNGEKPKTDVKIKTVTIEEK